MKLIKLCIASILIYFTLYIISILIDFETAVLAGIATGISYIIVE